MQFYSERLYFDRLNLCHEIYSFKFKRYAAEKNAGISIYHVRHHGYSLLLLTTL